MTLTIAMGGVIVFVVATLLGMGFSIAGPEPDPLGRLPKVAQAFFCLALLGFVVAFGATVVEIALRCFLR